MLHKRTVHVDIPIDPPRIILKVKMCRVDWDFAEGYDTVADRLPLSDKVLSAPDEIEMIPYGCVKRNVFGKEIGLCDPESSL